MNHRFNMFVELKMRYWLILMWGFYFESSIWTCLYFSGPFRLCDNEEQGRVHVFTSCWKLIILFKDIKLDLQFLFHQWFWTRYSRFWSDKHCLLIKMFCSSFNEPLQCVSGRTWNVLNLFHWLHLLVLLQVIAPEEIVDPNVDEHSVMTYLSQFPKSKLKPGAPLRAKTLHPKRAKAYGPGQKANRTKQSPKPDQFKPTLMSFTLRPCCSWSELVLNFLPLSSLSGIEPRGNVVLKPAEFLVETVEAGLGEVLVYVEDPEGHTEEVGTWTLHIYLYWVIKTCSVSQDPFPPFRHQQQRLRKECDARFSKTCRSP